MSCARALALAAVVVWSVVPANAAPIVINSAEIWDGTSNPHGVTLIPAVGDGSGNFSSPAIYQIPDGLTLNAGAIIYTRDPNAPDGAPQNPADLGTPPITFEFLGSNGLHFGDASAFVDPYTGVRDFGGRTLTLNMNGKNITSAPGAGAFEINVQGRHNMAFTVNDANNITLDRLDFTHGDSALPHVNIEASGTVDIGFISTLDNSGGGNPGGSVNITASQIRIPRGILTYADRTGSATSNGNITLTALAQPLNDPTSNTNTISNRITLGGLVKTNGIRTDQTEGNVTLTAPQIIFEQDFVLDLDEGGTLAINAGIPLNSWQTNQLFVNKGTGTFVASHTTNWNGLPTGGPNDVNGDNVIDIDDFAEIRDHFGETGPGVIGDTNFDDKVDLQDFVNWRNAFSGAPGAVPEPSTLLLGLGGVAALALVRRRREK